MDGVAQRKARGFTRRLMILDGAVLAVALTLAAAVAYPGKGLVLATLLNYGVPVVLAGLILLRMSRFYDVNVRYLTMQDLFRLGGACVGVSAVAMGLANLYGPLVGHYHSPYAVILCVFCFTMVAAERLYRRAASWKETDVSPAPPSPRKTLVVGAGDAGAALVLELKRSRSRHYGIVGFLDDDANKWGQIIHDVRVLGATEKLPSLAKQMGVTHVLIAVPSSDGAFNRRMIDLCTRAGVAVKTLPSVVALLDGSTRLAGQLREVDVEDLLRRQAVKANIADIAQYMRGQKVLITGGGGSIGSELARQIAALPPKRLILLGKGENSIYEIEQELLSTHDLRCATHIADVRDSAALERVFEAERPNVVLHAAAHKHVPLMQANPIEAIRNNVLGTWNVANLASRYKADKFILVSTDKAVNPSSVMGATKRVCELIVQGFALRSATQFASVRFGNVLGSRGSILPLLKSQIQRGGPIRLTHEDMTRYFMTIPEAAQLIISAGNLASEGEIYILDMGEPVKIKDLAYDLVRLLGMTPNEDIEVQYIGPRPGEKLTEQLAYERELTEPTSYAKILRVTEEPIGFDEIERHVAKLADLCEKGDQAGAHDLLMSVVQIEEPALP